MDNGRNRTDRTMLGSGEQPSPVRLWWARLRRRRGPLGRDQRAALRDRVQPAGLGSRAAGSSSPTTPATPSSAPGALSGDELEPLWRRDGLAHAGHLILYPDTRELVVGDWRDVAAAAPAAGPRRLLRPPRAAPRPRRRGRGGPRCAIGRDRARRPRPRHAARRRPASTSPPRRRASSSPPPASAATSTTSR